MDLEGDLDRLYQLPPGEFVGARNQLARELKKAGSRTESQLITGLPRPSPVAWLVNQLHFHARAALDSLRAAGDELKRVQETGGDAAQFSHLKREHQRMLRAATDQALALAEGSEVKPSDGLRRRLEMTLNLISAAGQDVTPGRLSAELEPVGFDALTAAAPGKVVEAHPTTPAEDAARRGRIAAARSALEEIEREIRRLEEASRLCHERFVQAAHAADEAVRVAEAARGARDAARHEADDVRERLTEARAQLEHQRRVLEGS